jgi:hypothetical protein
MLVKGGGKPSAALTVGSRAFGKRKTLSESNCPNRSTENNNSQHLTSIRVRATEIPLCTPTQNSPDVRTTDRRLTL